MYFYDIYMYDIHTFILFKGEASTPDSSSIGINGSSSTGINGSAPEPVRRRRRTEDNALVTRPNRKSKVDDTISKVIKKVWIKGSLG